MAQHRSDPVQESKVKKAVADPNVPKIYANGFELGLSNSDAFVLFVAHGQPTALLNISFTLAKTLQQRLGVLVAEFESKAGREILTTDDIDKAFKK